MKSHLCISVTLLDPLFHGKGDAGAPEWPPSPFRLFQALLAGARTGCREREWSAESANAFRWLERQGPPTIIAPRAKRGAGCTLFVANNDTDILARAWAAGRSPRRTAEEMRAPKTVLPHLLEGEPSIHFVWPLPTGQSCGADLPQTTRALRRAARSLVALGWGIDQAFADGRLMNTRDVAAFRGVRWKSWPSACGAPAARRRVPSPGTLEDLERVHRSSLASVKGKSYAGRLRPQVFERACYLPETALPPRPFAPFDLRDSRGNWRPFPQGDLVVVAAMLRSRACAAAQRDTHEFPGGSETYVGGHVRDKRASPPRFSYLPLPSIGHPHADGMVRRALVAEGFGGDGTQAEWAATRLAGTELLDTPGRTRALLAPSQDRNRVLPAYVAPSVSWFSVTPVVLPGFDDCQQPKAKRLLLKALAQAGVPCAAVADFGMQKAPFWPGSQHPRCYRRPDYLRNLPAWHVRLRLREPVPGPLAVGAGRHCGLGLFAAETRA